MIVTIRGKRWAIRFSKHLNNRGECDSPTTPGKEIRVGNDLAGRERLEVIIHECLHAAFWDMDEEAIEATAEDLARILTALDKKGLL